MATASTVFFRTIGGTVAVGAAAFAGGHPQSDDITLLLVRRR